MYYFWLTIIAIIILFHGHLRPVVVHCEWLSTVLSTVNIFNNYIKKSIDFFYPPVMKTERHISLAYLHLLLIKWDSLLIFLSISLKTSSLFCRSGLTCNLLSSFFFRPVWKIASHVLGQPCHQQTTNLLTWIFETNALQYVHSWYYAPNAWHNQWLDAAADKLTLKS